MAKMSLNFVVNLLYLVYTATQSGTELVCYFLAKLPV